MEQAEWKTISTGPNYLLECAESDRSASYRFPNLTELNRSITRTAQTIAQFSALVPYTHTHSFGPIYSFNNHVLVGEMKRNKMLHANPDTVQFIFSPVLCVFSVDVVYLQRLHALLLFKERRKKPYESVLSYHFQHSIDFIHIGCHCSVLSLSLCMGESIDARKKRCVWAWVWKQQRKQIINVTSCQVKFLVLIVPGMERGR